MMLNLNKKRLVKAISLAITISGLVLAVTGLTIYGFLVWAGGI